MAASLLLVWGRGVIAPHLGRTAAAALDRGPHRGGGLEWRRRGGLEHHRERAQGSPGRRCPLGRGGPGCRCPLGRGGGPVRRGPGRVRSGSGEPRTGVKAPRRWLCDGRHGKAWRGSGRRWIWGPAPASGPAPPSPPSSAAGQRGSCSPGNPCRASAASVAGEGARRGSEARRASGRSSLGLYAVLVAAAGDGARLAVRRPASHTGAAPASLRSSCRTAPRVRRRWAQ